MADADRFLKYLDTEDGDDPQDDVRTQLSSALAALADAALTPKSRKIEGLDELGRTVMESTSAIASVVAAQAEIAGRLDHTMGTTVAEAQRRYEAMSTVQAEVLAKIEGLYDHLQSSVAARERQLNEQAAQLEAAIKQMNALIAKPRIREAVRDDLGRITHVLDRLSD